MVGQPMLDSLHSTIVRLTKPRSSGDFAEQGLCQFVALNSEVSQSRKSLGNSIGVGLPTCSWTSESWSKTVRVSCAAQGFLTTFSVIGARDTRQLEIFPLATTTVGWVPDQHTRRAETKWRTRSEAESCAGGLPTDNAANGKPQREKSKWVFSPM